MSADQANETGEGPNRTATDLLATAMTNLRLHSPRGRLDSLVIGTQRPTENGLPAPTIAVSDLKPIWESAGQTFWIATHALQASAIPVEKLDVFGNIDRCSLSPDRFGPAVDPVDLSVPLQALKDLSLAARGTQLPKTW